jgi:tetratricopeptide (TPR) repeat protein
MSTFTKFFGLIVLLSTSLNAAELDCKIHYATALEQMSNGNYALASAELQQAIRLSPIPNLEYLPYLNLAVANFEAGRFSSAREALIQSQIYGKAAESDVGIKMLNEYAADIMTAPPSAHEEPLPQVAGMSFRDFEQQEYTLSDESAELIRSSVLKRCAVSPRIGANKLPWYFHYEYGRDLLEAGDAQRALDMLVLGANVREDSKRGKRMYGMWFIDYLPYYQIAVAHSKLGNWESAYDAIKTSENFGEFSPDDPDYESFTALDQLIKSNIKNKDS